MNRLKLWAVVLAMVIILCHPHVTSSGGQFYGGSMSYAIEKRADGKNEVTVEVITGWILGRGPCGPGCDKADIGRSTRSTRRQMLASDPGYLGSYTSDYMNKTSHTTEFGDMTTEFNQSYNESVIAVSENGKWEQELLHFNFIMPNYTKELDINFDGDSWRTIGHIQIPNQRPEGVKWHFQTRISSLIRSDTGNANSSPKSIAKPFYRVKLGKITEIRIPTVDADNDFIRCEMSVYVEGGDISLHKPPYVTVHENCSIFINASESNKYTDGIWIAVPVNVRDYNREDIMYGEYPSGAYLYSLSAAAVQFLVQVLANLTTPEFVNPTPEGNHVFIMYADTTWRTDIYAEAIENTTIESFTAFGIQQESLTLSSLEQDRTHARITYTTLSWKPSSGDIGRHIVCVSASDNTGVDSAEQRCFILDVQAETFNHTSQVTPGRPYFVDIPSPAQFVNCKIATTCVVPLYIKSTVEVTEVKVTKSFIDDYHLGPIEVVTHKGKQMYQVDLFFQHSSHGKADICFMAIDKNANESEKVCMHCFIESPDPCVSAPCVNSGTCIRDKDTGAFICQCQPKYSGKTCAYKDDPCVSNPCVVEHTMQCIGSFGILCYCKDGFTGDTCSENINDCTKDACNGHGSCKDKVSDYDCECFDRYDGSKCGVDKCGSQTPGVMSCPADGCLPNTCNGIGVCSRGGLCSCPYGFSGLNCQTRKCNIPNTSADVDLVPPSMKDGSKLICYTKDGNILPCSFNVYMAVKASSSIPSMAVVTSNNLETLVSAGTAQKSSVVPGISNLYTAEISISGKTNNTKAQYICVTATSGTSSPESLACYELIVTANPEDDATSFAHTQKDAAVKFVQPTLKDRSRILCNISDICRVLLFTSFSSKRAACAVRPTTSSSAASNGSSRCEADDKDNDEDETDTAAKKNDPCCKDVISSTSGVTVYPSHPRGPSCVSEASFSFTTVGEKEICFLSAMSDYQQMCYKVGVYDTSSGQSPCSSSPCQNNGHCFNTDHNNYRCLCQDKYTGDKCETGPCQTVDDNCKNDAYCQTNNGVPTCICKAEFSGSRCNIDPASLHMTSAAFTDTATPTVLTCVRYQECSVALILTGQTNHLPSVSTGYVDPSLQLEEVETVARSYIRGSYQTNIKFKPLELGQKDFCIQTKDTFGVNKDELCFKVNVISDVISIYGFQNRPHFIEPSLPTNSELECDANGPCHVLYHVTPGKGSENECVTFHSHPPDDYVNFRLFSSCDTCKPGDSTNGNCTIDVSLVNPMTDINVQRRFCLSVGLLGSSIEGEERCFSLTVKDPSAAAKTGCQTLECKNGGFCDGHIPSQPTCFCPKGFSGSDCGKFSAEVNNSFPGTQTQHFIGDLAVPSEINCVLNTTCYIPLQVLSRSGSTPSVVVGNVDPLIYVQKPTLTAVGSSYEGKAIVNPYHAGDFKVCFQANSNSKTEDVLCVTAHVTNSPGDKTVENMPHFLPPTMKSGSIIICEIGKTCHFDMYFTIGNNYGSPGECPTITATSPSPGTDIHIFDPKLDATACTADVSYIPSANGNYRLCLQVALPGKRGERVCFTVKVVTDIRKEDIDDCQTSQCQHGGTCRDGINNYMCICTHGYKGVNCESSFSLEEAIQVKCSDTMWDISIDMITLKAIYPNITFRDIYLGQTNCVGTLDNTTLKFQYNVNECQTSESTSGITNVYSNKLFCARFDPVMSFLIRQHFWTFVVECDVILDSSGTSHLHHGADTHHETFVQHYNITVELFTDRSFLHQLSGDQAVHIGDDVYVKVSTPIQDWNTKMRLHTCFTRPHRNATTNMDVTLISDGCEANTNTHIISQSTHETRFVFQDFEYETSKEGLDVYCNATYCDSNDYSSRCAQSCQSGPSLVG